MVDDNSRVIIKDKPLTCGLLNPNRMSGYFQNPTFYCKIIESLHYKLKFCDSPGKY